MKHYACHNRRPFKTMFQAKDTQVSTGGMVIETTVTVPFRMETDCQYTSTELGQADARCDGCKWRLNVPSNQR